MLKQNFYVTDVNGEKEDYSVTLEQTYDTLIDFLLEFYPDGFEKQVTIFVDGNEVIVDNYDMELQSNSSIVMVERAGWVGVAIFAVKLVVGLAVGYGVQKLLEEDTPETPASPDYKNIQPSAVYDVANAQNRFAPNQPIPSLYGNVKTYPSLIAPPYYRYSNNNQFLYQLMAIGQGDYSVQELFVGNTSFTEFGDIIEYKVLSPEHYTDECTLRNYIGDPNYHQAVYLSPDVSNVEIEAGQISYYRRVRFNGDRIYYYKGTDGLYPDLQSFVGETVTFPLSTTDDIGVHNNSGTFTVTGFDDTYKYLITDGMFTSEHHRDVLASVTASYKTDTTLTNTANDLVFTTTNVTVATNGIEKDFRTGQVVQLVQSNDSTVFVTITAIDYVLDSGTNTSTLTLTTSDSLQAGIKQVNADDLVSQMTVTNTYGWYTVNPTDTKVKIIEMDVVFPNGLYRSTSLGDVQSRKINYQVQVKDELGAIEYNNFSTIDATKTPVRKSIKINVDNLVGQLQVKIQRLTATAISSTTQDAMFVTQLKAPILHESLNDWGDLTLLWVKAKATNGLSSASQFKINANVLRTDVNNNVGDVIEDIYSNPRYGGKLDVTNINLPSITEEFNGAFESRISILDAMKMAGKAGRYTVTPIGNDVEVIKDTTKPLTTAIFNETNMIKDTFELSYTFGVDPIYDGVSIEYRDAVTFMPKVAIFPQDSLNPVKDVLFGCVDYDIAMEEAQYRHKTSQIRRAEFSFVTDIQGLIPRIQDKILIGHNVADKGTAVIVDSVNGQDIIFDEVITRKSKVIFRYDNGSVSPTYDVAWMNNTATISGVDANIVKYSKGHMFDTTEEIYEAIVTKIQPSGNNQVKISAITYSAEVFDVDAYIPPVEGGTGSCGTNGDTTPPMIGEDDNGAQIEIPGPEQPEVPEIDWAELIGWTVLGGLVGYGAIAGVEAILGECSFNMNYHVTTNTCEYCPEYQQYVAEDNNCQPCESGYTWNKISKLCEEGGSCDPCDGGGNAGTLWYDEPLYDEGDIVSWDKDLGVDYVLYISLEDDNKDNQPDTSPTFWQEIQVEGNQGLQGEVEVDSTITVSAGTPASVEDLDPSIHKALLKFSIPQGEIGIQGEQGIKGDKGDTGTPGSVAPSPEAPIGSPTACASDPKGTTPTSSPTTEKRLGCFTPNPSTGRNNTNPNLGVDMGNGVKNALKAGCIPSLAGEPINRPICGVGTAYNIDTNACENI